MDNRLEAAPKIQARTAAEGVQLPVGKYRFLFAGDPAARLPAFAGSAWRGAFGHALKRAVCVTRLPCCSECLLYRSCAYPYIFETPPPLHAAKMRRYVAAPHPFVMETPLNHGKGGGLDTIEVGLSLFGQANRCLPYVVYALQRAGQDGIGRGRVPLQLTAVEQSSDLGDAWQIIHKPAAPLEALPPAIPDVPPVVEDLRVRLLTPLRIRRAESLVSEHNFTFADFFNVLLRRISMLTYFHTDTPLETDFKDLVERSRNVTIHNAQLRWYDWTRYSLRQHTTMQMGGIIGEFQVPAEAIEPFWPYLWIGQWTHAGKSASMGLGQYRIGPVGASFVGAGLPARMREQA
ncbi:MAG: CRISPR system precrRNA processing endoribonuclease RAMP protein Cas6 [Chromatiales bacterium]